MPAELGLVDARRTGAGGGCGVLDAAGGFGTAAAAVRFTEAFAVDACLVLGAGALGFGSGVRFQSYHPQPFF